MKLTVPKNKKGSIKLGQSEAHVKKVRALFNVPSPSSLFKTINSFLEFVNIMRIIIVNEA